MGSAEIEGEVGLALAVARVLGERATVAEKVLLAAWRLIDRGHEVTSLSVARATGLDYSVANRWLSELVRDKYVPSNRRDEGDPEADDPRLPGPDEILALAERERARRDEEGGKRPYRRKTTYEIPGPRPYERKVGKLMAKEDSGLSLRRLGRGLSDDNPNV